ncbi:DUF4269 domain-containing protein [Paenibacillus lycopersici]|uniref:DUF4269 domain-containing protein n=1 Tax=Paenibacillus lycopersici TaxID=2704462 RepID=A0A6C0G3G5_9BACL|nr:DUF4269 domain-containing protein [Paenibacillus lycopersici]QHT61924.1 DUF4269 domain-containing protein [Paenibacillus lycopersici]
MHSFNEGTDWTNLSYLQRGSAVQAEVFALLTKHRVMDKLAAYDPVLVGTVPIGIETPASDLDVICRYADAERFESEVTERFGREIGFGCHRSGTGGSEYITANFMLERWPVEIYGARLPVREQNGYRHMVVEARLLALLGEAFRERIVRLKYEGVKTEPAFVRVLGIDGDPYEALLAIESWSDELLQALQSKEA